MSTSPPQLIGVLGRKRHGKDTIADHLVHNYGFVKRALVDPLKEVCETLFLFTHDQLYGAEKEIVDPFWQVTPRQTMQFVGTDLFRDRLFQLCPWIGNRFWDEHFRRYHHCCESPIVVPDIRFQSNVDMIHSLGGIVIKVVRPGITPDPHPSETAVDEILTYDYLAYNDGTIEDLWEKIDHN